MPIQGPEIRLRALLDRATSGQRIHGRSRLRPSLVDKVVRDPFWVWCQYHAPKSEAVNEISRYEQMRYRRGVEHEAPGWPHTIPTLW